MGHYTPSLARRQLWPSVTLTFSARVVRTTRIRFILPARGFSHITRNTWLAEPGAVDGLTASRRRKEASRENNYTNIKYAIYKQTKRKRKRQAPFKSNRAVINTNSKIWFRKKTGVLTAKKNELKHISSHLKHMSNKADTVNRLRSGTQNTCVVTLMSAHWKFNVTASLT